MSQKINRLLLTGAAGGLGKALRPRLNQFAQIVRVSDVADLGTTAAHEEAVRCDLGNYDAMLALLDGVDAVVHLGGMSIDGPFEPILNANIRGAYNLYEGVRQKGVKRVVFASSNHTIGMYSVDEKLKLDCEFRPDCFYGLSKVWGEAMSRMYWDKHGIEGINLRIGSTLPRPTEPRHLATWLGHEDLLQLMLRCIEAENIGYLVAWGVSNNTRSYWDNSGAERLGYHPVQNSEDYAAEILAILFQPESSGDYAM